ncbi:Oidioi.mRNA.OKI2018_I69.PAR.g9499.t1.cds [Oikopleura dioica]|uniref:Oidioi.mRNA.OKI2018_I69.PAR.g9499.t1.cds n=1 Tax=Oikopleura dioica TaxID=34765 RepID=A0ABN7RTK5_OIKDI|nr:Oidioi.mRNA.OKI2018_I69.PAR.g9499.t1.cds [Oikopleura dioica]
MTTNRRGQNINLFIRKANFRVGRRLYYGWIMGYELQGQLRIRYFSTSKADCPVKIGRWFSVPNLRRYSSSPRKIIQLRRQKDSKPVTFEIKDQTY